MGKLDEKVALITGAGSGIGRAAALLFSKEGAKVGVADYNPAGGQETVRIIKEAGGEAIFAKADVSKSAEVQRMIKDVVDAYGRIDILYNNAGILRYCPTADITEEEWDLVVDTNLKGTFLCSKYAIPVMIKHGGGVIITTTSTSGLSSVAYSAHYGASKAGVINLTKTIAMDYGAQKIRANCICPGGIITPMTEAGIKSDPDVTEGQLRTLLVGRFGQAEDVAKVALFLACDDSSFVTGSTVVVDGGRTTGIVWPIIKRG
jgi:NAD(P)-dependent dehydrogenase (short-subunit alcohol dehydrogenase family)